MCSAVSVLPAERHAVRLRIKRLRRVRAVLLVSTALLGLVAMGFIPFHPDVATSLVFLGFLPAFLVHEGFYRVEERQRRRLLDG